MPWRDAGTIPHHPIARLSIRSYVAPARTGDRVPAWRRQPRWVDARAIPHHPIAHSSIRSYVAVHVLPIRRRAMPWNPRAAISTGSRFNLSAGRESGLNTGHSGANVVMRRMLIGRCGIGIPPLPHRPLIYTLLRRFHADLMATPDTVVGYALDGFPIMSPLLCADDDCATIPPPPGRPFIYTLLRRLSLFETITSRCRPTGWSGCGTDTLMGWAILTDATA